MSVNEREKIHHELLEALYIARKQVEQLEAALAHNAAYLGTGVERESQIGQEAPDHGSIPKALARYLDLVEPEDDISDFIGREGHDESRPRLGPDAPPELRPDREPRVDSRVGLLAMAHPEDSLIFSPPGPVLESTPGALPADAVPLPAASAPAFASTVAPAPASAPAPAQNPIAGKKP